MSLPSSPKTRRLESSMNSFAFPQTKRSLMWIYRMLGDMRDLVQRYGE